MFNTQPADLDLIDRGPVAITDDDDDRDWIDLARAVTFATFATSETAS